MRKLGHKRDITWTQGLYCTSHKRFHLLPAAHLCFREDLNVFILGSHPSLWPWRGLSAGSTLVPQNSKHAEDDRPSSEHYGNIIENISTESVRKKRERDLHALIQLSVHSVMLFNRTARKLKAELSIDFRLFIHFFPPVLLPKPKSRPDLSELQCAAQADVRSDRPGA